MQLIIGDHLGQFDKASSVSKSVFLRAVVSGVLLVILLAWSYLLFSVTDTALTRGDSVSNVSEPLQENINKLREDYGGLARDVELIREEFRAEIKILKESLESIDRQNRMITELVKRTGTQAMDREDAITEKLDKFHFTLSERLGECEERLEQYNNQMTTFEKRFQDEGERMATPDFAVRGRDAISSVITFSLSLISFVLFVFTAIVDAIRMISENNAIATSLSLALFVVIVGMYHYFGFGKT